MNALALIIAACRAILDATVSSVVEPKRGDKAMQGPGDPKDRWRHVLFSAGTREAAERFMNETNTGTVDMQAFARWADSLIIGIDRSMTASKAIVGQEAWASPWWPRAGDAGWFAFSKEAEELAAARSILGNVRRVLADAVSAVRSAPKAPPKDQGKAPPKEQAKAPPKEQAKAPPKEQAKAPPKEQAIVYGPVASGLDWSSFILPGALAAGALWWFTSRRGKKKRG